MPGNAALPAHEGVVLTRGLQEWSCLLSVQLPFRSVERLLGWQSGEGQLLSASQLRVLVQQHGEHIRQLELEEAQAVAAEGIPVCAQMAVCSQRVDTVQSWLVGSGDCSVMQRDSVPVRERIPEGEVVMSVDEVLVRHQGEEAQWHGIRTACVATAAGYRYVSGVGEAFVQQLHTLLGLCAGEQRVLRIVSDGAQWIRDLAQQCSQGGLQVEHVLDWYHLKKKCYELSSLFCRGGEVKRQLLRRLLRALWGGDVDTALGILSSYRSEARRVSSLEQLMGYLERRRGMIVDYGMCHRCGQVIGSGWSEKANDLLVARRQKGRGMRWGEAVSDGLAALQTLLLNGGWDMYWQQGRTFHKQHNPALLRTNKFCAGGGQS